MKPKEVHESRPIFREWPLAGFRTNLSNLRDALARDYGRMLKDIEFYGHDAAMIVK